MKHIRRVSRSQATAHEGRLRYEHWLVDNQVYFITARCRDRFPAFASEDAKAVFWSRFTQYTKQYGFTPWVTSLLDNHYHTLGYLQVGANLLPLMQRLHGSVAKQVNDELERHGQQRRELFWRDSAGHQYFDGCIRDQKQARLAYRYTLTQAVRHGVVRDWRAYAHTRIGVELDRALRRALELGAFLEGVPYKRYLDGRKPEGPDAGPAR